MFKHVLVPLDGSPLAETAVHEARRMMTPGTSITLVTVVQNPKIPIYGYDLAVSLSASYPHKVEEAMAEAKGYLEKVATGLRNEGYKVNLKAGFGNNPAGTIVKTARHSGADVIVMSTHRRTGVDRLLHGSVTGKVLSDAACPVMVIQGDEENSHAEAEHLNLSGDGDAGSTPPHP